MRLLAIALAFTGVLAATGCNNMPAGNPNDYYRVSQQKYGA